MLTNDAFEDAPFIPNHDTITCYQPTCLPVEHSKQVMEHSAYFPVFCSPCPKHGAAIKAYVVVFFIKEVNEKNDTTLTVLLSKWQKGIANSHIQFDLCFTERPNFFGMRVVVYSDLYNMREPLKTVRKKLYLIKT